MHQAARYLCPGFNVSLPVGAGVETGVLKELLGSTFVEGLQESEGWLDFAQVAEDLDTLEQDVWSGGTLSTQAARLKVFSSLRWRLADFLEQAARVLAFWIEAGCEADARAQDFVTRASVISSAQPHLCAWRVCEPLDADIFAFVHRVAGGGSGDFSHEAAGNFAFLAEAVEECMRQAREFEDTFESLAEGSRALGRFPAGGPGPPVAGSLQARAVGRALLGASPADSACAGPVPSAVIPSVCRGN